MNVYPDPVSDFCRVSLDKEYGIVRIEIYNAFGAMAGFLLAGNTKSVDLDLRDLPNGIFMLVVTADNISSTRKIIRLRAIH